MRTLTLALAVCLVGCTHWAQVPISRLDGDHAFVDTASNSYELTDAHVHDNRVVGRRVDAPDPSVPGIAIDVEVVRRVRVERVGVGPAIAVALGVALVAGGVYFAYGFSQIHTH